MLVRRLISALIWDISGLRNRSDGRDFKEKRIDISRFLALYILSKIAYSIVDTKEQLYPAMHFLQILKLCLIKMSEIVHVSKLKLWNVGIGNVELENKAFNLIFDLNAHN